MVTAMVNDIDATLAALADPTRRLVVELLSARPLRAGELADEAGMSRPAMSRHLRALRTTGLVEVELSDEDGRGRTYHVRRDRLVALHAWLDQLQTHWSTQLGPSKAHAGRTRGR